MAEFAEIYERRLRTVADKWVPSLLEDLEALRKLENRSASLGITMPGMPPPKLELIEAEWSRIFKDMLELGQRINERIAVIVEELRSFPKPYDLPASKRFRWPSFVPSSLADYFDKCIDQKGIHVTDWLKIVPTGLGSGKVVAESGGNFSATFEMTPNMKKGKISIEYNF